MRSALAPAAVCAVAGLVLLPNHPAGRAPSEDAGVFFYVALRLLEGGVPYRDVWDHKPPLIYAIDALGLLFAGRTGVWLVQLLALILAALASLRALAGFGSRAAVFGTVAWLVAAPRLFLDEGPQTSYVEFFGLPLQLGALALYARGVGAPGSWRFAAIGALGGMAFLLKPTLGGVWIALVIALIVESRLAAARQMVALVGATIAVVLLALVPFATAGALPDLVDQAFRYNSVYAAFAGFGDRLSAIALGVRLILPSGLVAIAAVGWLLAITRLRTAPPVLRVALIAAPLEVLLATFGRAYNYYYLPWLPAFGILAAYVASEVQRRLRPSHARLAIVGAAVLMAIVPAILVARLTVSGDDGIAEAAAAYVAANTRSDQTVLIWGSRTEVLVLAERRAPTRYIYQYAPLSTRGYATPERIAALVGDLEREPPTLIVDASLGSFVTPPLDRAGLAAFISPEPQYAPLPELVRVVEFVEARYDRVGEIPGIGWPVWRLRSG